MTSAANLPEPLADSVDMAAFRLGICRAQLYREVNAGRLRVRKLGRRTLVPRIEQARWLAALPEYTANDSIEGGDALTDMSNAELLAVIGGSVVAEAAA